MYGECDTETVKIVYFTHLFYMLCFLRLDVQDKMASNNLFGRFQLTILLLFSVSASLGQSNRSVSRVHVFFVVKTMLYGRRQTCGCVSSQIDCFLRCHIFSDID